MRDMTADSRVRRIASRSIVLADKIIDGTITVENGIIVAIDEGELHSRAEDWGTDHVLPGLVELHTDHLEPHYAPRPKVLWNPAAAVLSYDAQIAASGITTVFDCVRAGADGDRNDVVKGLFVLADALTEAKDAGSLRVDHKFHLRCEICSDDVLTQADKFIRKYPTALMSLMDHSPGQRQYRDVQKLRDYYRGKARKTEAELDAFITARLADHARNHDVHRAALLELAKKHRMTLASHDDTTVEQVAESQSEGMKIAEFPTTTEAAAASHAAGMIVVMGAPNVVRGGSHSGNVAALELAEMGVLDALSSDYVPASLLLGAVMLADVARVGGLPGAIRLVSKTPAMALGLSDRGEIAVGLRADILRVDLSRQVPVVRKVYSGGRRVA